MDFIIWPDIYQDTDRCPICQSRVLGVIGGWAFMQTF